MRDFPLGLAAFRNRLLLRAAFLVLMLAVLAFAIVLLQEEKARSHQSYEQHFDQAMATLTARLRHPAGQLALMNSQRTAQMGLQGVPVVLPYGALDFDDQNKAQQAVEMTGCSTHYPNGSALCIALGSNPYAGGFIYVVGHFLSEDLVAHHSGELSLSQVHRARVRLDYRGEVQQWVAPFERTAQTEAGTQRGRLTGFVDYGDNLPEGIRTVKDFRGWLWQGACQTEQNAGPARCLRRAFFSMRLPVEVFQEALFPKGRAVTWPPRDLDQMRISVKILPPEGGEPLLDSSQTGAQPPFSLDDLSQDLRPGETLEISRPGLADQREGVPLAVIKAPENLAEMPAPWLTTLIRHLPIAQPLPPNLARYAQVSTATGNVGLRLTGSVRNVDRTLSAAATRVSWMVVAMLATIFLIWLIVEWAFIRRIALLTKRAATLKKGLEAPTAAGSPGVALATLDVQDLRGRDELGILAGSLADLLQRVKDDARREQIRVQQERDMWHAVGHEIMSPLQSLMVLHAHTEDAGYRYVQRMQQAIRVLYGTASPSEALAAAALNVRGLDIFLFLQNIAQNAHYAGIDHVVFQTPLPDVPVYVEADEFSLEDVLTHLLVNANRHRMPGTPIVLEVFDKPHGVVITVHNTGPGIEPELLARVFEYGVTSTATDEESDTSPSRRGQGLFVAKTYMAKMGGTIRLENENEGVTVYLTLQRDRIAITHARSS